MVEQVSSLCEYLIEHQTPSLEGRKITHRLCENRAEEIHIFRFQPDHESESEADRKAKELHYYCHRHGNRRMWQMSVAHNYGNPKITWACVPVDDTPMPMEFWDNSNISPTEFPLFAELYKQTYGSVPVKHKRQI